MSVSRAWLVSGLVTVLFAACCSGDTSSPASTTLPATQSTAPTPTPVRLHATLIQYRPDEGTNRIEVELTDQSHDPVTVRAVRIRWAGVQGAPLTHEDTTYAAGQTIDLTTTYGRVVCGRPLPTEGPRAVAILDHGNAVEVALDRRGTDMLKRFRARDCALRRLQQAASVTLGTTFHSVTVDGTEYLRGNLELRRPDDGGGSTSVTVSTLTGSVLLTFAAPPTSPLPATLQPGVAAIHVPVLIGSTFRCDDHGRSQSTQTYLLSAYVRVGDDRGLHRVIVVPDAHLRAQAQGLMERACRRA